MPATKTTKPDTFLADAIRPRKERTITYADGFRFGFGFFVAGLFLTLLVAGLSWALVALSRVHY